MIPIQPNSQELNEDLLREFMDKVGTKLPNNYLQFLYKYNGGTPDPNVVHLEDSELGAIGVDSFFGVGATESYDDLIWNYEIYKGRVPSDFVPIAHLEGGDVLCISLASETYGHIYVWDHEVEGLADGVPYKSIHHVAKSFDDFLDKLQPDDPNDVDLSNVVVESVWIDPEFAKKIGWKPRQGE